MNAKKLSPEEPSSTTSRRRFLQLSGGLAAGTALAQAAIPPVHAGQDDTIRLALIGCGGRGTGAVANALEAPGGPVSLYAMADLFSHRLDGSRRILSQRFPKQVDVSTERQFIGFDAYRSAMDCLKPGDIVMLTGYAGWRPVQLEYAVAKGLHVFMEKSFATDPPGLRRVIEAGQQATNKNLKVAAGLMCRHSRNRQELIKRIRDGMLGDIQLIRAYRMQPVGPLGPKPQQEQELHWQIRNFVRFFWVSGGLLPRWIFTRSTRSVGSKMRGRWWHTAWEVVVRAAPIAARTWIHILSSGPLLMAPKRMMSYATCPIVTTNSPPMSMAPSVRRNSRAIFTPEPCAFTETNDVVRTTSSGRCRRKS